MSDDGFDEAARQTYLTCLADDGMSRVSAAATVGLTADIVERYVEEHLDFALARAQAEQRAVAQVESALFAAASSGNLTACMSWLERREEARRNQGVPEPPPQCASQRIRR